ncbi:MAG: AAA family ATPase [Eubacteriales bacterium]|nr:AAA family ATPase [Eubacteriales bacterium]
MGIEFPLGIDSFEKLRSTGRYYVDKTEFIGRLLQNTYEVNLVTRPRRFGKTLAMSMLEDFFDISKDSSADFEGLKIRENQELCAKWMNQWPVLFLTLKSVEGNDFESAYGMLRVLISGVCKKYAFLENSDRADRDDIRCFRSLKAQESSPEILKDSLHTLMRMMNDHYGKPVILLIDEYDVPLAKASEAGYYSEMMDVIRAMLGKALKTNEFLKFAVITGCLKIAKESIFTGTNNFVSDTITGDRFDEYFGFTEADVHQILADANFADHAAEIKTWYDGYRFGSVEVYCPWDVLNHVAALQLNPRKKPQNYWGSTSHNGIIYRFISREDLEVNHKFEKLMAGEYLIESVTEDLTYDTLRSSEENLWSLLYLTGYLTRADLAEEDDISAEGQIALKIPNEEVRSIFKTAIVEWFNDSVKCTDRKELFEAMWSGDDQKASLAISDLLFSTISYHDYKESYYHAFLAGIFAGAGYIVESNYERGTGRPDVVVKDKKARKALIIEAKHADSEKNLESACRQAMDQIVDKRYTYGLERGYQSVISYGAAFFEKECLIKRVI